MNRRTLILSSAAGVIAGGAWGATIQALARPSTPTLSVIGKRDTQLILLDTTQLRVLILLGAPDDDLQEQIPALLTMLRQRIDILVGTPMAIDALGPSFEPRWRVTQSLVFPDGRATEFNTSNKTWITRGVTADLGDGLSLDLSRTTRDDWKSGAEPRSLWAANIGFGGSQVTLAPDLDSALILSSPGPTLAIVPQGSVDRLVATLAPASIAMNSQVDLSLPEDTGAPLLLVRTYPQDIARFELREDGIALPTWAEDVARANVPVANGRDAIAASGHTCREGV